MVRGGIQLVTESTEIRTHASGIHDLWWKGKRIGAISGAFDGPGVTISSDFINEHGVKVQMDGARSGLPGVVRVTLEGVEK
jgi:hypothetical protein